MLDRLFRRHNAKDRGLGDHGDRQFDSCRPIGAPRQLFTALFLIPEDAPRA
jgi:hypothetical protein